MEHITKIKSIEFITHDVLHFIVDKPNDLSFKPGQAAELSINKKGWEKEKRPFTFTSLPDEKNLEFIIKTYPSHNGVTNELLTLKPDDEFIFHDVFGAINYQDEGIFIAGGAGITPFISIFKELEKENKVGNNKLIFANKTKEDIILNDYFHMLLKNNFINILSDEEVDGYEKGRITKDLLKQHLNKNTKYFYVCGPVPMIKAVVEQLSLLGIDKQHIIKEDF